MNRLAWHSHLLTTPDLDLAWYEAGQGEVLLFLSGGPGDASDYLRPFAEPLTMYARCVLFDQRGTGGSAIELVNETTMHVERFFGDIEALRQHLGVSLLTLIGHSWGAELALRYAVRYPTHVGRLVLIGLGPLDDEGREVAHANTLQPLTAEERRRWQQLSKEREQVREIGDWERYKALQMERMALRMRSHFYDLEVAERSLEEYRKAYSLNPEMHFVTYDSAQKFPLLGSLYRVSAATLVIYGYQDFEPITQAYRIREEMPQTEICLINRCGHLPWLEQPDALYEAIGRFLGLAISM